MIRSMTGYGFGEAEGDSLNVSVEIRSLNHRFCEVNLRMPKELVALDGKLRKELKQRLRRGRLDVFVDLEREGEQEYELCTDLSLVASYLKELRRIKEEFNLGGKINIEAIWAIPPLDSIKAPPSEGGARGGESPYGSLTKGCPFFRGGKG